MCKSLYPPNTVPTSPHSSLYLPQWNPTTESSPRFVMFVGRGTRVHFVLPFAICTPYKSLAVFRKLHSTCRKLLFLLESHLAGYSVLKFFLNSIDHPLVTHLSHSSRKLQCWCCCSIYFNNPLNPRTSNFEEYTSECNFRVIEMGIAKVLTSPLVVAVVLLLCICLVSAHKTHNVTFYVHDSIVVPNANALIVTGPRGDLTKLHPV
jgi:hypothetical protein